MSNLLRTPLFDRHVELGAQMVPFGGWEMPVQYPSGILQEHLATRRNAGLFDVSHMGRFVFRGARMLEFLQHSLTNNAAALDHLQRVLGRPDLRPGRGPGQGARGAGADERADGGQGRPALYPRGQPARQPHGALPLEGHRCTHGRARHPHRARRITARPRVVGWSAARAGLRGRQGARVLDRQAARRRPLAGYVCVHITVNGDYIAS